MNNNINSFINLLLKTIEEDKVFVMPINGTSMLPFLDSSKKVKLKKAESLKKGEMYFYKRENGQYVLHRLIKIKNDNLIFRGDNQFINENDIKENQIIAKVVEIIDENGNINNLSSLSYKIYVCIMRNIFFKKVYFKLRRIFKKWKRKKQSSYQFLLF